MIYRELKEHPFFRSRKKAAVKLRSYDQYRLLNVQQQIQSRFIQHRMETGLSGENLWNDIHRVLHHEEVDWFTPCTHCTGQWCPTFILIELLESDDFLETFCITNENGKLKCPTLKFNAVQVLDAYLEGFNAIENYIRLQELQGFVRAGLDTQLYQHNEFNSERLLEDLHEAKCIADQLFPKDLAHLYQIKKRGNEDE